ncbi:uncharacterized protein LOC123878935 [Maniola jurtina]|uniref:uncharacterized protein LOC123878935 n=1 Tax=Maniola jurtina TaxID=191418 RepID=UPI001E6879BB|nr:uncharacterized protein LOC123878935 [Maniola jurtina]
MKRNKPGKYVRSKRMRKSERDCEDFYQDTEEGTDEKLITISQTELKGILDKRTTPVVRAIHTKPTNSTRTDIARSSSVKDSSVRKPPVCFRCHETGHVAPNCSQPDNRKCYRCGEIGHVASSCSILQGQSKEQTKKVQILSNLSDTYKKTVKVNNTFVKAYIDTGSEMNVMSDTAARAIGLTVKPTDVILRGFAGNGVPARGTVEFSLHVDNVQICTTAVTTDIDLGEVALIIGQPVINDEGISFTVTRSGAELNMTQTGDLKFIDVIEEANRYKVQMESDTEIPVGDSLVKVVVEGAPPGELCTKPRQHSIGATHYAIASSILRGGAGYLRVCNIGEVPLRWKKGDTIARAEQCMEIAGVSANLLFMRRGEIDKQVPGEVGGLSLGELDVGDINESERYELIDLLVSHSDCFASSPTDIGETDLGEMSIKLTTDKPVNRKPYRLAHAEREVVTSKIEEMLESNIIRESASEYASPIILVRKKNGDYRLCVDYRALNAVTVKERFPLPHIDDQLSKLAGKRVFTSLDLFAGYHNIKINPNSVDKTAFVTPDGHFEYLRVPFGLANAPSVFMRFVIR